MPRNWDNHYSQLANLDWEPAPLLVEAAAFLGAAVDADAFDAHAFDAKPRALDLACGAGRNALHLARIGWRVSAVDRSAVAIRVLRERAAGLAVSGRIDARIADLEKGEFLIAPAMYDLICDFFYLQRDLFPAIREGIRPGGLFTGAIYLFDERRDSAFVMQAGELRREFQNWEILFYSEDAPEAGRRRAASIIAKRPPCGPSTDSKESAAVAVSRLTSYAVDSSMEPRY